MSVLQREIEAQGVATVSLSLYRDVTEKVRPPRALWVPFPFGRPLGAPNDKAIQRKVILAALALLSRPEGPVLEDFVLTAQEEHLDARNQTLGSKCGTKGCNFAEAVSSPDHPDEPQAETVIPPYDGKVELVRKEIDELRGMHRNYMDRYHGRTQIGHSGLAVDTIQEGALFLHEFATGQPVAIPQHPILLAHTALTLELFIRLTADDLKAYYTESRLGTGQSDQSDTGDFNEWFWFNTRCASLIKAARDRILDSTDRKKDPYCVVARGMVPRGYGENRYMTPREESAVVVIYHGDGCSACHAEMEFLEQNEVAFVPKNVTRDTQARQELVKLGSRTVPTTVIAGQVIVGFDVDRLKQLLNL